MYIVLSAHTELLLARNTSRYGPARAHVTGKSNPLYVAIYDQISFVGLHYDLKDSNLYDAIQHHIA